jgi:MerR family copper efflux transcriptional regulator
VSRSGLDLRAGSNPYRDRVSTYTIGEIAARSGFSASALRYYEDIGLVTPASRTDAGYRVYEEPALQRLAFIARAKQLGCSLEEIADLVALWDGERCGIVQRRLHRLVTEKLVAAQRRIEELQRFTVELRRAAAQLGRDPVDAPCGPNCACLDADAEPDGEAVHIACSLEPGAVPGRLAAWDASLASATTRHEILGGVELAPRTDLAELARLVVAEQACCPFFSFAITVDARGPALEVRAPDGAAALVAALVGNAAASGEDGAQGVEA